MDKQSFFARAIPAAVAGGHIFPGYAAAEAALESGWGGSRLAIEGNNLFGQKHGFSTEAYPTLEIETREVVSLKTGQAAIAAGHARACEHDEESTAVTLKLQGKMAIIEQATWAKFPDWNTAFRERMQLLYAISIYAPARAAKSGEEFVRLVSVHWATDPKRADEVLDTYLANVKAIQNALMAIALRRAPGAMIAAAGAS